MTYNPYSLEGKRILITGASSGIGRAAAIECSRMGAEVIVAGRNEQRLEETLSLMDGSGHEQRVCDLADPGALESMVDSLPRLSGLVNNAGTNNQKPIPFITRDALLSIFEVNTIAPIVLMCRLVKKKKLTRGSSVVFTDSMSGLGKISPGNNMYGASKGAITSFVMGSAKELGAKGIRVNSVCPAMVETEFIVRHVAASDDLLEADRNSYPLKRYGRPEEVAWAIVYLLSDAAAWVTGTNMVLDGGRNLN